MNLLPPPRPPNLSPPKPLLPPSTPQEKLLELSLQLVLCSFSYDFIGATLDEASEELGTIQVPSSWRGTMEEPSTTRLFFNIYLSSRSPSSATALEVTSPIPRNALL